MGKDMLSKDEKDNIIRVLAEHGAKLPCPRCGNQSFTLLNGYFNETVQADWNGMNLGGTTVPSVVVICDQCGYLSQHALGLLGLLPKQEDQK